MIAARLHDAIESRHRHERGAVIPLIALCISLIILVGAFTVDLGRAMLLRRDLQRVADVTALDASKFLDGTGASTQLTAVRNAAVRSAQRNHWTLDPNDVHLVVQSGTTWTRVDATTTVPVGVEVVAHGSVAYNFQPSSASTSRSAVAARQAAAGIEIGTSLATLDTAQATMLNKVLGLFGGNPGTNLSLVTWQGFASANVTLGQLTVAAGAADADTFLRTTTTYGTRLQLVATALSSAGNTTAAGYVTAYRSSLGATVIGRAVQAGDLLAVSGTDADSFADASIDVFSLLRGQLLLARQGTVVNGTFASGVTGIADVTLSAQVVKPPTIAFGPAGTTATNGQLSSSIGTNLLGLVPVQFGVGAASGTATLASVPCGATRGPATSATASVTTTLTDVTLSVLGLPVSLASTAVPPTTLSSRPRSPGPTRSTSARPASGSRWLLLLLNPTLAGLLGPLETAVVSPVARALGVSVAGAVAVLGPMCLPPLLAR